MSQLVASASPANPPSIALTERDRVVRVFVSSTFRDMVEDRNTLMAQVWPALRQLCRGRAVEFVAVDLRWGITEAMSQQQETLRHCLAEIKRCRPYFIGLLGERYGWVLGPEAYTAALLQEEHWLAREVAQHSVTELEILHGVLNDPEMAGRAFFYCRDPAYAQARGSDFLAEDATGAARQQALKGRVRAVCREQRIPLREGDQYHDPRALAGLVLADLTAAINTEFPADQAPDAWTREHRDHAAYAQSRRTRFYVGRDSYYQRLDAFARDGTDGQGLVVLGDSGGGKSALLANWVAHWQQAHPGDFVFQHYLGSSPLSARHLGLLRRLMVAIIRWCGDTLTSVNNLAYLLRAKGDLAAAEPLYRRALEAGERVLGPTHPDTLTSVNNLADLLQAKGDYAAAEPLYRRALEGYERGLGPGASQHADQRQQPGRAAGRQRRLRGGRALVPEGCDWLGR